MKHGVVAERGLAVFADGVQAAFAAGAVAEMWRLGVRWDRGCAAGLGAQVAILALLGCAEEGEQRWRNEAEPGCQILASALAEARARIPDGSMLLVPDAARLGGWLDATSLERHLAPETAGLPERLRTRGKRLAVAVDDLTSGLATWISLEASTAAEAAEALRATSRFPAGWPALEGTAGQLLWGGVGAAVEEGCPGLTNATPGWDVVCGFPVPPVPRPGLGPGVLELVQRRAEVRAARLVQRWLARPEVGLRVLAPTTHAWAICSESAAAELGVEYPLPWECNAGLALQLVELGRLETRRQVATFPVDERRM